MTHRGRFRLRGVFQRIVTHPREHQGQDRPVEASWPSWVAYEPDLVPPLELMRREGIDVLEE
jgi:hypothetical protein